MTKLEHANPKSIRLNQDIANLELHLQRNPNDIAGLNQLAMLKASCGQFDDARTHMSVALKLAPRHPLLHYNLGQIHGGLGLYQEEIQDYQRAIALKPDFVEAYVNMGVSLRDLQQFNQAFEAFKQAIRLNPDHPGARTNRAQTNLMLGNFEHGWREYAWRWHDGHQRHGITGSLWNGKSSLKGKRLLIHAEQGLGDTVQFSRYLNLLLDLGAGLTFRVQAPLVELFRHSAIGCTVIDETSELPEFDFHIPLMNLPEALFTRTKEIPAGNYAFHIDHAAVAEWNAKIQQFLTERRHASTDSIQHPLRVGLCWAGNPQHLNDLNRSIRLANLDPILSQNCLFISVQKELQVRDLQTLSGYPLVLNAGPSLNSLRDTAAVIRNMDLVLTVDTSVAHLCGALGIETWVLLPEPPDWRWMLKRNDCPWYPSVRLFRQTQRGQWASVIQEVAHQLAERIQTSKATALI